MKKTSYKCVIDRPLWSHHPKFDNIIYPINVDNECKYTTEILNEVEYKEKYKAIYSIIRLIRDYK